MKNERKTTGLHAAGDLEHSMCVCMSVCVCDQFSPADGAQSSGDAPPAAEMEPLLSPQLLVMRSRMTDSRPCKAVAKRSFHSFLESKLLYCDVFPLSAML